MHDSLIDVFIYAGIYLLNLSTSTKAHPLKPHESDALLDDLLKYFGECLAFAPPADGHDSDDEEGAPKKRRDLESFQQASKLSARLSNVDLAYYLNSEDGTIFFIKLANIVCMHARYVWPTVLCLSVLLVLDLWKVSATHSIALVQTPLCFSFDCHSPLVLALN